MYTILQVVDDNDIALYISNQIDMILVEKLDSAQSWEEFKPCQTQDQDIYDDFK